MIYRDIIFCRDEKTKNDKAKSNIDKHNTPIECPTSSRQIEDDKHTKQ